MKLYYSPGACSLSPHIVLHEAGLAYTPVLASTKSHKLQDGTDFYTINPLGYVPVLELDSGERLREGQVIVQYLADLVPEKNLAPANGTLARYRLQEWLSFIGTEVHKSFTPLFIPGTPEDYKPQVKERLLSLLQWIDGQLADTPYLMGERFTVADAYLFTVSGWGQYVGVDISGLKNLLAYRERIAARPAVQAAMKAEGLI
ncbi:glutathione transferase GstA [Acidovorax sp. HDW3]|uniref:glutathione transferase GstA n=1 Tax=Acidovorax sp. HDW3 TaxID=2714923 RepID=UPI0014093C25|nr:glutathione transferase GstA [Acidovorax sp. HDW3]QIL45320.1 glutathione transferase GstA [Acidovorax sp. HDW3]